VPDARLSELSVPKEPTVRRPLKMNNEIGVSCEMIVARESSVLLGRRKGVFGAGSWAFPGGHLEKGEHVADCARRELAEEVGIEPLDLQLIGIINDLPNGQDRQYLRFVFLSRSFKGQINNREPDKCEGWQWFEITKLPAPIFVGHVKPLQLYLDSPRLFFSEL
jgi:8-oxo-dGTP diphosphatase